MSSISDLLQNIQLSTGLTLAEVLARHPDIRRRTAQRWLAKMTEAGQIIAIGEGRARRYFPIKSADAVNTDDIFPQHIPLFADSIDILAYVDRPITIRTPVGYQRDFLESYQPNKTRYLSDPLCRQLKKWGIPDKLNSLLELMVVRS